MHDDCSYIHEIATLVPDHRYDQAFLGEYLMKTAETDSQRRLIKNIYPNSGIESRYSVVSQETDGQSALFPVSQDGTKARMPSTGERNDAFRVHAKKLALGVAKKLLEQSALFDHRSITHIITVSCTGFYAPGMECEVIEELNLPLACERYNLGFMGCYASFPALRLADTICRANADAVVMVISVELCSLHLQPSTDMNSIMASALFADGAAGALVSRRQPASRRPYIQLERFHTELLFQGKSEMAWTIGDSGFEMILTSYVSKLLSQQIHSLLKGVFKDESDLAGVDVWAIHPGGKSVLTRLQTALSLPDDKLKYSYEVLRNFGNMSSATILFVLERVLKDWQPKNGNIVAMAFGPGLTVASFQGHVVYPEAEVLADQEATVGNHSHA